jgi:hypothetical protein
MILFIVLIVVVVQLLNVATIARMNRRVEEGQENLRKELTTFNREASNITGTYSPVLSSETISRGQVERNINVISQFIAYNNSGSIMEAYNLLTEESRQLYFPTVQDFVRNYHSVVFSEHRMYNTQLWANENGWHTYRVEFIPDILTSRCSGYFQYNY